MKIANIFRLFTCWCSTSCGGTREGLKQDFEGTPFLGRGVKHEFEGIPVTGAVWDIPLVGGGVKQDHEDIPVAVKGVEREFEDIPVTTEAVVKQEFGDIPLEGGGVKQNPEDIQVANGDVKQEFEGTPFVPEKGFYQPTEETWEAYQALVTLVGAQLQTNLPDVVMFWAADEVLSVLKCNNITTLQEKKAEIEKTLNPVPHLIFNQMVSTAELITDYSYDRAVMFVPEFFFYQPRSDDTRTAYKMLLDLVNNQVGYKHPQIQQCVLANKVLEILNGETIEKGKKREDIEYTLGNKITDDTFDMILFIGERITDFKGGRMDSGPTTFGADAAKKGYLGENSIDIVGGFDYGGQIEVYGFDDSTDDEKPVNLASDPTVDVTIQQNENGT